jgi:hypothetical protein
MAGYLENRSKWKNNSAMYLEEIVFECVDCSFGSQYGAVVCS